MAESMTVGLTLCRIKMQQHPASPKGTDRLVAEADRSALLQQSQQLLQGCHLSALVVLSRVSKLLARVPENVGSNDSDECLLIMGFASDSQREDLQRLQDVFENISDLQVVVNVADGPTPSGVCEACVSCWTRCRPDAVVSQVPLRDVPLLRQLLNAAVNEDGDGLLQLAEHQETWVSATGAFTRRSAQFEGYAEADGATQLGRFRCMDAVDWYTSPWQGKLLKARWQRLHGWSRPQVPLRLHEAAPLSEWLQQQESLVGAMVDPSIAEKWAMEALVPKPQLEMLAEGVECKVFYIPKLLSHEDCQNLIALALQLQQPQTTAASTVPLLGRLATLV
eukprot:s3776_g6.t1